MSTKRRAREASATRPEPAGDGELTRVLDEELANLPDKYREPVVLCELEGVPRREAADRLGIANYVLDYEQRFRRAVIEDFASSYAAGETPIPGADRFFIHDPDQSWTGLKIAG